jgi:hypothetical protein
MRFPFFYKCYGAMHLDALSFPFYYKCYGAMLLDALSFPFYYKYYGALHLLTFGVSQEPDNSVKQFKTRFLLLAARPYVSLLFSRLSGNNLF